MSMEQYAATAGSPARAGMHPAIRDGPPPDAGSPARAGMHLCQSLDRVQPWWLPCASRDAPSMALLRALDDAVPLREQGWTPIIPCPPTRNRVPLREQGCTLPNEIVEHLGGGSPARAGIAPVLTPSADAPASAPLREQGCTHARAVDRHAQHGSPARAGMDRVASLGPAGDGGSPARAGMHRIAPPRRRGAPRLPCASRDAPCRTWPRSFSGAGSPARAGMHPVANGEEPLGNGLPCASRDAPYAGLATDAGCGLPCASRDAPARLQHLMFSNTAPLREQGCTQHRRPHQGFLAGSPARAGMHPPPRGLRSPECRLPCASRDAPVSGATTSSGAKAPLREQGCTAAGRRRQGAVAGSPARAGMHRSGCCPRSAAARLPCASRDAPQGWSVAASGGVAPLRKQGCTVLRWDGSALVNGSPARAGMHLPNWPRAKSMFGLPCASRAIRTRRAT